MKKEHSKQTDHHSNAGHPVARDPSILPYQALKGRGAISNNTGRFEQHSYIGYDDGWLGTDAEATDNRPLVKTTLSVDSAKSIITRNQSPDVPFDRSINPYRGCEHGCVYCFARPTHAYLGLSPGLDFETRLFWKPEAPEKLRKQLSSKSYVPGPVVIGSNTDPYQPIERDKQLTRSIISVLKDCKHPFSIITKNALVCRDIDLIMPMAHQNMASVAISVTSLDNRLSNLLEPRASAPHKRLEIIRNLSECGIPVTVLCAPVIPGLNDSEIEQIVKCSKEAGAVSIAHIVLRLPLEIADLFSEWLEAHYPNKKGKILSLISQMRNGKMYQAEFGTRMQGSGPVAEIITKRFHLARKKYGLNQRTSTMDCSQFIRPSADGQLSLF